MMNKTSQSSDKSQNPDSGVTDSPWQPSWWQWLISALSGTVETEKRIAWLKKSREEANKREEEAKKQHEQRMKELNKQKEEASKQEEEVKKQHEQRMKELREDTEKYSAIAQQIEKENERLAVLESKIDGLFSKYGINSKPVNNPEEP